MPSPYMDHRGDREGRGRGRMDRGEREREGRGDRDRDRDRGMWDDHARHMELSPGQRGDHEERYAPGYPDEGERYGGGQRGDFERGERGRYGFEEDDRGGRFGRGDEERMRYGRGYGGPQGGYGMGQSGYAAGYDSGRGMSRDTSQGSMGGYGMGPQGQGMGYGGQGMHGQGMSGHGQYGQGMQDRQGMQGQQRGQGEHRGKGPSGYTRSDERIKEQVCDLLTDDPDVDASGIDIQVKNGEVTLTGTVPDRRMKRMAEECIENCSGVKDVTNNLKVQQQQDGQGQKESRGGTIGQSGPTGSQHDKDDNNRSRARS